MSSQRTTFGKLQRERDKKARAAAKRERRLERAGSTGEPQDADVTTANQDGRATASQLLELLEKAHRQYEAEEINHEEFEEQKAAILARLPLD